MVINFLTLKVGKFKEVDTKLSMPESNYCQVWYCWRQKSKWSSKWCNIHRCQALAGVITGRSCGQKRENNSLYCIRHQYFNR